MNQKHWRLEALQAVVFVPPMGSSEQRLIAPYTGQRLQMMARRIVIRIEDSGDTAMNGSDAFIIHSGQVNVRKTAREIGEVCCDDKSSQIVTRSALNSPLSGIVELLDMIPEGYPYHVRFLILVLDFRPSLFKELFGSTELELMDSGDVSAHIYHTAQKGTETVRWNT